MKTFVIDHTNIKQVIETRTLPEPAAGEPEDEIQTEEVDLIASGYEWNCPNETCAYIENKEIEITKTVTCKKCKTVYKVNDYHHAHG